MRVEHEYFREGAWTYLAAWDLIVPSSSDTATRKVALLPPMASSPRSCAAKSAKRVFWILDNCSANRGQKAVECIPPAGQMPLWYTLLFASWVNQTEIYFAIVQRKVLTPNNFFSLSHLEQCLMDFQKRYEQNGFPIPVDFQPQ